MLGIHVLNDKTDGIIKARFALLRSRDIETPKTVLDNCI